MRLRSPATNQSPPVEGLIETAWVGLPSAKPPSHGRQKSVVHFMPQDGGAWLETETFFDMTMPEPLTLPSASESSSYFNPEQSQAQQAAMVSFGDDATNNSPITLAQFSTPAAPEASGVMPLPGADGIVTMPPAYPNTWAPLAAPTHPALSRAFRKVGSDYGNFYSCESLVCVTAAFGAGALMANTGFDTTMQNAWQSGVAPTDLGTFFSGCKPMGEGKYALPIFGVAAATGLVFDGNPVGNVVGEWGSRSLRMFLVGAPPLYVLQLATGASRPSDGYGSQWHFNNDNNGVSGHAFVGAIPFLAAAEMVESPLLKGTLYVCSTFTSLSRMTDNAHYPSQVFLAWYLAWASSIAVSRTEMAFDRVTVRVVPVPVADLGGLGVEARW
jgi:hypothetical protein